MHLNSIRSDLLCTGPTSDACKESRPQPTSQIDDVTFNTSAHRVPATVRRWPRRDTKGPPRDTWKGTKGAARWNPIHDCRKFDSPTVSTHAFFPTFPAGAGATQQPANMAAEFARLSKQEYFKWKKEDENWAPFLAELRTAILMTQRQVNTRAARTKELMTSGQRDNW